MEFFYKTADYPTPSAFRASFGSSTPRSFSAMFGSSHKTLYDLKADLRSFYGKRVRFVLDCKDLFADDGALSDDATLEQCGLKEGSVVLIGYRGHLLVRFEYIGLSHLIQIDPDDTVGTLKEKIASLIGVPEHAQTLEISSNKVELSDSARTLISYGMFRRTSGCYVDDIIFRSSILDEHVRDKIKLLCIDDIPRPLCARTDSSTIKIHVKTGYMSTPLTFDVDPMYTIGELKVVMQNKYILNDEPLMLVLDGRDLFEEEEDLKTFQQCGIKNETTLMLGYRGSFQISFYMSAVHYVEMDCYDTLGRLREHVKNWTGYGDEYPLVWNRVWLAGDYNSTLLSYGIFRTKIGEEIHDVDIEYGYIGSDSEDDDSPSETNAGMIDKSVVDGEVHEHQALPTTTLNQVMEAHAV